MENTGYVALSYAVGLERKMDIVSNNIANVNSSGYKSGHMVFREHIVNSSKQKPLSMVEDFGNYRNLQPGPIQETGNPLDIALEGNGFIAVTTPTGEKYTRNGAMRLDSRGQLVVPSGDLVSDAGGKPLTIPPGSGNVTIAPDGTVSTEQGQVGRIKIVRFNEPQKMTPVGSNLYETTAGVTPDLQTRVSQGSLEGSNVNAVLEMTDMIEVLRKYQSVARILQTEHDSQLSMIQKIGRV